MKERKREREKERKREREKERKREREKENKNRETEKQKKQGDRWHIMPSNIMPFNMDGIMSIISC